MRTTVEETERNYNTIIDVAIKIFSEKSYEATNMQDIADAAGISRGPLYYHFKNKIELYSTALSTYVEKEYKEYQRIFSQDAHILEKIKEDMYYCCKSIGNYLSENLLHINGNAAFEQTNDLINGFLDKIYQLKLDSVVEAIRKGELREDINPRHIVNLMFVCFEGLSTIVNNRDFFNSSEERDAIINDLISLISMKYCK